MRFESPATIWKPAALDAVEILDRRVLDDVDVAGEKRRDPRGLRSRSAASVTFFQCGCSPQ